jgi:hypothetical protein
MNEDQEFIDYDQFAKSMEEKFPKMFAGKYGGFAVGKGWYPIIESLCNNIQHHINWVNETRERLLTNNPWNHTIPDECPQVIVEQIKEKFGGLRFYYQGGDDRIQGMVSMAESWAGRTCEECGSPGKSRGGGWIRTLCDEHEEQRQEKMRERYAKNNGLEL